MGRKTDSDGVASWVLERTVALDKLLSMNSEEGSQSTRILMFAEENNVVLLWTYIGVFKVQFESLQLKLLESYSFYAGLTITHLKLYILQVSRVTFPLSGMQKWTIAVDFFHSVCLWSL
ncbi:hypothetical protein ZWY2020_005402 [Hordeum vulgare]|nr:hypothetical protein ZWY2020_005402 [Hordeum vulgare]